jgi:Anthrone oxygenase
LSPSLNDDLKAAGDPDRIADLAAVRDAFHETRWVAWNIVRAVATTAAFVCLTWALVLHGRVTGNDLQVTMGSEEDWGLDRIRRNDPSLEGGS